MSKARRGGPCLLGLQPRLELFEARNGALLAQRMPDRRQRMIPRVQRFELLPGLFLHVVEEPNVSQDLRAGGGVTRAGLVELAARVRPAGDLVTWPPTSPA